MTSSVCLHTPLLSNIITKFWFWVHFQPQKYIYSYIFSLFPLPFFQLTVSETKSTGAINKKNTSKKLGKKKKNESKDEEDDIDKLLAAFDKVDNVCNGEGCKAKIATLGVTCQHCRRR